MVLGFNFNNKLNIYCSYLHRSIDTAILLRKYILKK